MDFTTDVWQYLRRQTKPILLYGMGNGADKVIEALSVFGIPYADVFASDGFVRGQFFHGRRVLSLSEAEEKYGDFICLICFGSSLAEVIEKVAALEERHEVLAPDVPVCGGELFTAGFYKTHKADFAEARALLSDSFSQTVFDAVLAYKTDGRLSHLRAVETEQEADMQALLPSDFTAYIDCGAYTGDTLLQYINIYPSVTRALAFEPSSKSFAKLCARLEQAGFASQMREGSALLTRAGEHPVTAEAFAAAAWCEKTVLTLADGSARNSTVCNGGDKTKSGARYRTVQADFVDAHTAFSGERLFIKYDVEGAEKEALCGSACTVCANSTSLLVSCYHKSEDLFALPRLLHSILPGHRLFLRKHRGFPAWDINLYVTE